MSQDSIRVKNACINAIAHRFRGINSTKIRINLLITSFFSTQMKYFFITKDVLFQRLELIFRLMELKFHSMEFTFQPME